MCFCDSVLCEWNNDNAHFLRDAVRELTELGCRVVVCEPAPRLEPFESTARTRGGKQAMLEAARLIKGAKLVEYLAFIIKA